MKRNRKTFLPSEENSAKLSRIGGFFLFDAFARICYNASSAEQHVPPVL